MSLYIICSVPQLLLSYNQAYDTTRGSADEMSVLGSSSFMMTNDKALSDILQKDGHNETVDGIQNSDPPPPPEDQASSGIYETIPGDHSENEYDPDYYLPMY